MLISVPEHVPQLLATDVEKILVEIRPKCAILLLRQNFVILARLTRRDAFAVLAITTIDIYITEQNRS